MRRESPAQLDGPRLGRELRAVVTDIDGTLTGTDRALDPGAIGALRRLDGAGIPVVLATGNVLPVALAIHRSLGLSAPIVAENGGIVYTKIDGRERIERLADRRVAWAAFLAARRAGLPLRRLFTDRWRETEVAVEPNVPVRAIARAIRDRPVRVEGTGFAVHLMQSGAGKEVAVTRVLDRLGLRWGECLVAGDGDNDVGMIRSAGWSISFATGSRRARRAADFVAESAGGVGFVEGLKERGEVRAG